VTEAEQFLRQGLRANPDSCEILFALAQVADENREDFNRARNVYELALAKWNQMESVKEQPNVLLHQQIAARLARLEERVGHWNEAIRYLELVKKYSPYPDEIQKQIEEVRRKVK
jgi:tetratricopeptide (TPR) repeat protein